MGNGFICDLTGYCPASVAPASAPMVGLDLKNKTVTRQVTPAEARNLFGLNGANKITIEEPINQGFLSKPFIVKAEAPKISTHDPNDSNRYTLIDNTLYLSHDDNDRGNVMVNVEHENTDTYWKDIDRTKITLDSLIPFSVEKKTVVYKPGIQSPQSETTYTRCILTKCVPSNEDEYKKMQKYIPHFVDGELVQTPKDK